MRTSIALLACLILVSCGNQPDPAESTDEVETTPGTYAWIDEKIIQRRCIFCHSGPTASKGVDLTTYETIMGGPRPLVVAGEPDLSVLYTSLIREQGWMPKNKQRLPEESIQAVKDWILAGAQK